MFSQVCVKNSVPGGRCTTPSRQTPPGRQPPLGGARLCFTRVCNSIQGGVIPACLVGYQAHSQGGSLRGLARSTPRGIVEGSRWGGSPGPHPGESLGPHLGGSRSTLGGVSQHALRQTPQQTATAAGGTHSTGMHSCFFLNLRR